ncbi:unnamed protein product [Brassica rapa subsp. trilocularis]|uniref:(rape) hypothetical protein n=1 Tax=Brassica napus TaxID=3708 RepID=A0A078GPA4_BRANA|nr:unnamed protein product [Brassica napus]CDY27151.1 BnaA08g07890D [Brassica napus]
MSNVTVIFPKSGGYLMDRITTSFNAISDSGKENPPTG